MLTQHIKTVSFGTNCDFVLHVCLCVCVVQCRGRGGGTLSTTGISSSWTCSCFCNFIHYGLSLCRCSCMCSVNGTVADVLWINPGKVRQVVWSFLLSPFDRSVWEQCYLLHFSLLLCHFFHPLSQWEEGHRWGKHLLSAAGKPTGVRMQMFLRPHQWWMKLWNNFR